MSAPRNNMHPNPATWQAFLARAAACLRRRTLSLPPPSQPVAPAASMHQAQIRIARRDQRRERQYA